MNQEIKPMKMTVDFNGLRHTAINALNSLTKKLNDDSEEFINKSNFREELENNISDLRMTLAVLACTSIPEEPDFRDLTNEIKFTDLKTLYDE